MPRFVIRRVFASLLLLAGWLAAAAPAAAGGEVLRATLPNGLRVVIVRNSLAPVVTTEMNYLVGSNEAPAGFPGTAHALEHMMFRGSPGLSKDQLAEIAATLGGDFNADTTQTVTQYYFTVPAGDLDLALHIDALRMRGLDLSAGEWDKERGAIEQEVARDLSNPQYVFYSQLLAAMFKGTPYAHDALGTRASFDKTTTAMLRQFYRSWYAPNNAIFVIVGDVDPRRTLAKVQALFGGIPAKKLPPRPSLRLQPVKAETLHLPTDLPYGLALIAYRFPGLRTRDYAASQILADVLASKRGRLYALAPEGKALYAGFQASAFPATGIGFAFGVFPKGGNAGVLLDDMRTAIAATLSGGVPAELVAAAKRQEIAELEFEKNSVTGLANAWSEALAFQGLASPDELKAAFQAVTVADVARVAKRYLDAAHAITAILTPQSSGKAVTARGFGGAESFAAAPEKPVSLPEWARAALGRLSLPAFHLHPYVTRLPNGIRLIVQPTGVSDTVSVFGRIKNRPVMEEAPGEEGVSQVLDGLFEYGSTHLDRLAFQKALDAIAARERAGTSFSVQAPAEHFERAVALLADNELHPALPAGAFKVVREQTARFLAGELESPGYLFGRVMDKLLLPTGDPALRQPTPKTVMGLTLEAVRGYYARAFRPDLTTIVVIGKVTPAKAQGVISRYFGAWRAEGKPPLTELPPVPRNRPGEARVPDRTSVQDEVVLIQGLASNLHNPDRYALTLGDQILGQGFYASRLYRDLREKAGLVYTVNSRFDWSPTRAFYQVEYGCDPDKVGEARALILRDLKAMQATAVTPAELARAKAMLLRRIPLEQASTDRIAGALLRYSLDGLPLDEPLVAARRYLKLTAPEVQAAYRKWIRPEDFVQVVKGPAPK